MAEGCKGLWLTVRSERRVSKIRSWNSKNNGVQRSEIKWLIVSGFEEERATTVELKINSRSEAGITLERSVRIMGLLGEDEKRVRQHRERVTQL